MLEVATKAEEAKEAEESEAEVEIPDDTVTPELILTTRDYVVL